MTADSDILVELKDVQHFFTLPGGKTRPVLEDINLTLRDGELVAILGPSGCGKSTLIRIVAGLLHADHGEVRYRGKPVTGPQPSLALVFQQFALFPWLTVSQNIEQALIPRGLDETPRRQRVAEVISLIGLDGFEDTYPRELSGGMKQRVGIARALAVQPELLCMDEPFSQVDALTAETLRNEVVNLWRDRGRYPQSVLFVSHDIHEVAFMASRILVMAANPGRIRTILENPLPYPRDVRSADYQALVERLHAIITGLYLPEQTPEAKGAAPAAVAAGVQATPSLPPVGVIPLVEVRDILGLLEAVRSRGGETTLFELTVELGRTFTRTLLAVKAAEFLGFLETPQDHLVLTTAGKELLAAPRKVRRALLRRVFLMLPIVRRSRDMLLKSPSRLLPRDVLLEDFAIQFPQEDPKQLFRILVNWGKVAELWTYQPAQELLVLLPDAASVAKAVGVVSPPAS